MRAASVLQKDSVHSFKTPRVIYKRITCNRCRYEKAKFNQSESYPEKGRKCVVCGETRHFMKIKVCSGKRPTYVKACIKDHASNDNDSDFSNCNIDNNVVCVLARYVASDMTKNNEIL